MGDGVVAVDVSDVGWLSERVDELEGLLAEAREELGRKGELLSVSIEANMDLRETREQLALAAGAAVREAEDLRAVLADEHRVRRLAENDAACARENLDASRARVVELALLVKALQASGAHLVAPGGAPVVVLLPENGDGVDLATAVGNAEGCARLRCLSRLVLAEGARA